MHMNKNLPHHLTRSSSIETSWEQAAEIQILNIYSNEPRALESFASAIPPLVRLRAYLDVMITELQDAPAGFIGESFIELGRIARSLGKSLNFKNSDLFLEPEELLSIVIRKQRDYGHENIARFGRTGLLVRLHDKVARLENLLSTGQAPNNESIEDNVADVIGYSIIGAMWEAGTFLFALQGSTVVESARH